MEWHVTIATQGRLAAFPSPAHRRRVVRAIVRTLGPAGPLFCAADDHAHALLVCTPERAPRLAANLSQALRFVAAHPLAASHSVEVRTRSHLETLVPYILDQATHHQLATSTHPALWEGSSFLDLVGARVVSGFQPGILRELLPRITSLDVYRAVGLPVCEPADDAALAALGVEALVEAARTAVAVESLAGKEPHVVSAKRVVAHLSRRLGVRTVRIAEALGESVRTIQRSAIRPEDARLERAVRLWVAIRAVASK